MNGPAFLTANPLKAGYFAVQLHSHFEQVDPVLLALDGRLPPLGFVSHGADGTHEGLYTAQQQQSRHQLQVLNTLPAHRQTGVTDTATTRTNHSTEDSVYWTRQGRFFTKQWANKLAIRK